MDNYYIFDIHIKYFDHKTSEFVLKTIPSAYNYEYDKNTCELIINHLHIEYGSNCDHKILDDVISRMSYGVVVGTKMSLYDLYKDLNSSVIVRRPTVDADKKVFKSRKSNFNKRSYSKRKWKIRG